MFKVEMNLVNTFVFLITWEFIRLQISDRICCMNQVVKQMSILCSLKIACTCMY